MGDLQAGRVALQQLHLQHAHVKRFDTEQVVGQFQLGAGPLEGPGVALGVVPVKYAPGRDARVAGFCRFQCGNDDRRVVVGRDDEHDRPFTQVSVDVADIAHVRPGNERQAVQAVGDDLFGDAVQTFLVHSLSISSRGAPAGTESPGRQ